MPPTLRLSLELDNRQILVPSTGEPRGAEGENTHRLS